MNKKMFSALIMTFMILFTGMGWQPFAAFAEAGSIETGSIETVSVSNRSFAAVTYSSTTPASVSLTKVDYNENEGYVTASARATGSNITGRGFVYSYTNNSPTTSNSYTRSVSSGSGNYEAEIRINTDYDYCYIRAYATNNNGTVYSSTETVYLSSRNRPTVRTVSVNDVYNRGADITIRVSNQGGSKITSRGVVYSSSSSEPTLSNSSSVTVSGTTGDGTVSISNLSTNTKYYVRAYATNSYGTSYGSTLTFTTKSSSSSSTSEYIDTQSVTNITATSARAYGYIDEAETSRVQELGFVYSTSRTYPTTSDKKAYDSTNTRGRYSMTITGLSSSTTYYMRAYYKTSNYTYYGDVIKFNTLSDTIDNYTVAITYMTSDGVVAGYQTLYAAYGQKLTSSSLNIPEGYVLLNGGWSYDVLGSASISVTVLSTAKQEHAFMPSRGGYQFQPEAPLTRGEAAQILYNLGNKSLRAKDPIAFNDISNSIYGTAINYVSSNGYMSGYPDGSFRPEAFITRTEMAVVLCSFYGYNGNAECNFTDISREYWGYIFIARSTQAGLFSGYPDGTFKPENNITRAEVCTLFCKAEGRSLNPLGAAAFVDVSAEHWAYRYVMNSAVPI